MFWLLGVEVMDPALQKDPLDNSVVKSFFCKPTQEAANRKYGRHSPAGGSDSSSPGGWYSYFIRMMLLLFLSLSPPSCAYTSIECLSDFMDSK